MYDWSIPIHADAHRAELQNIAHNERLSRLGRVARASGPRLLSRALAWAGSRLQATGAALQQRYGVPANPAPLHS